MQYLSTFISGLEEPVTTLLKQKLASVTVHLTLDGLILYSTKSPLETIKNLSFVNNTFLVLAQFPHVPKQNALKGMLSSLEVNFSMLKPMTRKAKTFRIFYSKENTFSSINPKALYPLEKNISEQLQMRVNITSPQQEFWFLERREGQGFFLFRLTKNKNKGIPKGQLRFELAYLLNFLSQPVKKDVFLDPFSGTGAIPLARRRFPYTKLIANEKDAKKCRQLQRQFKQLQITGQVLQEDALHMQSVKDHSISAIVTDPPWGEYQHIHGQVTSFYRDFLKVCERLLQTKGRLVLLTSQKELMNKMLNQNKLFIVKKTYDILVSGKKARIYVMNKKKSK